ncbi:MAG: hypothetical protein WDW36_006509 [Sanguina aurantia]
MAFLLPDEMVVVMFDSYGGIINPMTGQLLAQLPSLGSQIHFEAMYSGSYAPLMMTYENNYTVVELFIIGNGQYNIGAWQYEDSLIPRLMPDVTILPNGVVVVANGFQAGYWGYGGQILPASLTALYYTPSSPFGSRFSTGPNSTISRGYHSEAVLTTNGTLLITGSDRTPGGFVAEYLTPSFVVDPVNVHPIISSIASKGVSMVVPYTGALGLNLGSLINVYLSNFAHGQNTTNNIWATLAAPSLVTHSRNSGQRLIKLQPIASSDSSYVFRVIAFHQEMESLETACRLDIMLVYEVVDNLYTASLYPVNVLRNFARLQARTPLIGLLDVDMLLSSDLAIELQSLVTAASVSGKGPAADSLLLWVPPKSALVLAAFKYPSDPALTLAQRDEMADNATTFSKAQLVEEYLAHAISSFRPQFNGHTATDYPQWCSATKAYPVEYALGYEPWIIVDRIATPYHDMRFRGFGMNKISHTESLNASAYTFLVHPKAFIVHRPHPRSSAKEQFNDVVQATTSKSNNMDFVVDAWCGL